MACTCNNYTKMVKISNEFASSLYSGNLLEFGTYAICDNTTKSLFTCVCAYIILLYITYIRIILYLCVYMLI